MPKGRGPGLVVEDLRPVDVPPALLPVRQGIFVLKSGHRHTHGMIAGTV